MKGYIIANVGVRDPEAYKAYTARTPGVVAKYGGKFIVRGGQIDVLEGDLAHARLVVLEFPSPEAARTFYDSADYQEIIPLRTAHADGNLFLVEGFDG